MDHRRNIAINHERLFSRIRIKIAGLPDGERLDRHPIWFDRGLANGGGTLEQDTRNILSTSRQQFDEMGAYQGRRFANERSHGFESGPFSA